MAADDFYVAGLALAVALVHEGPAPKFLSTELFQAIAGNADKVVVPVCSLADSDMKEDLESVSLFKSFEVAIYTLCKLKNCHFKLSVTELVSVIKQTK